MTREDIMAKLNVIFAEVLENEDIKITEDTRPDDIEEWDSIAFVYLTVQIEEEFSIELGEEMAEIECVSDIVDMIMVKKDEPGIR